MLDIITNFMTGIIGLIGVLGLVAGAAVGLDS